MFIFSIPTIKLFNQSLKVFSFNVGHEMDDFDNQPKALGS